MIQPLEIPKPLEAKEYFRKKMVFTTGPMEVRGMLERGEPVNVVDVRAQKDFEKGHIPGSHNLPKEKWESLEWLLKDKINIVLCYSHVCHLAGMAALTFAERGFPVMEMEGGMKAWEEYKLDTEKS